MENNDMQLLELAATAAGIGPIIGVVDDCLLIGPSARRRHWNPLTEDGDAFRLMVSLSLDVSIQSNAQVAWLAGDSVEWLDEQLGDDPKAAVRRCITRVAAEIGRTK